MLKLQYFGYLMRRADSLEKTLILGKIEGRRSGQQRIRWLDSIINSMDMSLRRGKPGVLQSLGSQTQIFIFWLSDWTTTKNMPANAGDIKRPGFSPCIGKIPWRRAWHPTPVFLPREPHGQRSLAGYTVHRVAKSWTQPKWLHTHKHTHVRMRKARLTHPQLYKWNHTMCNLLRLTFFLSE